jgi:fluoride exporter
VPILLIALGGAAGAASRFALDTIVTERLGGEFPFGTLVINVSGSFAIGLLFALAVERTVLPAGIRGPAMIGFIGAYTTFSTLMLETWRLAEDGAIALAVINLLGSSLLGMIAVVAGLLIGRALA